MENRIVDIIEAPLYEGSTGKGPELAYKRVKSKLFPDGKTNFIDYQTRNIERELNISSASTAKNINEVILKCENVMNNVLDSFKNKHFPIIIGGDHSVAMASIAAGSKVFGIEDYAVVYIDGHADINTEESSLSHNIHGMPLASSLGLCKDYLKVGNSKQKLYGFNTFLFGQRSIDELEYEIIKNNNVHLYENEYIKDRNPKSILKEINGKIGKKKVHVSFDVDVLDPNFFSSTGYLMEKGMTLDYLMSFLELIFNNFDVISMDIVEYNPLLDFKQKDLETLLKIIDKIICNILKNP